MKPSNIFFNILIAASLTGCNSPVPPSGLPRTAMQIGSRTYQLEIATNNASREHGLMERDNLPTDHGMIFVFNTPQEGSFWMHHTRFPLDIIFADKHAIIVTIATMKAYDEHGTFSDAPYTYAVELAKGEAAACGAKEGEKLQIPPAVSAAKVE